MSLLRGMNQTRLWTFVVLIALFVVGFMGLETGDAIVTSVRGLSSAALIFLVAAGLSLIFGLMDVLNLAHGELFLLGAYMGWTVYVRPDTFVDLVAPLALLLIGFVLTPLWLRRLNLSRGWSWLVLLVGAGLAFWGFASYPVAIWNPEVYNQSPIVYSLALDTGTLMPPPPAEPGRLAPLLSALFVLAGGVLAAMGGPGLRPRDQVRPSDAVPRSIWAAAVSILAVGGIVGLFDAPLTGWLFGLSTTTRFFLAMAIAAGIGYFVGRLVEVSLIRPLYDRLLYQLMITLGLGLVLFESVRTVWGRSEFNMPRPEIFAGTGEGCPATNVGDLLAHNCSTIELFGTRIRTYNEIFIPVVGALVLIGVGLLLRRSRIGMTIRAGVQDPEMVEAMGIDVRGVFTLVFGLGVALAALGGVLAAPASALSLDLGAQFLVAALIALAIGGLTSFPGAAVGALVVGLLQQFVIKYGQVGIDLPFLAEPFRPSPPLVPALTVLVMVIVLILLPGGLLGRSHQ